MSQSLLGNTGSFYSEYYIIHGLWTAPINKNVNFKKN